MAQLLVHIAQAEHNEALADHLLNLPYKDWTITACFYAAIHYFEARLFIQYTKDDRKHSDTSIPTDSYGQSRYSPHGWRTELVRKLSPDTTWNAFRKLRAASEIARYLAHPNPQKTKNIQYLPQPAYLNFEETQIKKLMEVLRILKAGMKVEMVTLIHELELHTELKGQDLESTTKLLLRFSSKADFLHNGGQLLREMLSENQMVSLEKCMQGKGYSFTN